MKSFEAVFGGAPQAIGRRARPRQPAWRAHRLQRRLCAADRDSAADARCDSPQRDRFLHALCGKSRSHGDVQFGCAAYRTALRHMYTAASSRSRAEGFEVPPLDIHLSSNVPIGVGLSSSAALEVATLRALRTLCWICRSTTFGWRRSRNARKCMHAGVRCGIMDQMAASLADTEQALFLDTRTMQRRCVPLPPQSAVLVLDSGITRALASSAFNQRRTECEEAASRLGVRALRDVDAAPTL